MSAPSQHKNPETIITNLRNTIEKFNKANLELNDDLIEAKKEITRLKKKLEGATEVIEICGLLDRSQSYEYGETDRQGNLPGPGKRWLTPREKAKAYLKGEHPPR